MYLWMAIAFLFRIVTLQSQKQQWSVIRTLSKEKVCQISAVTFYENFNFSTRFGRKLAVSSRAQPMIF